MVQTASGMTHLPTRERELLTQLEVKVAANQAASIAIDIAGVVADLNALLVKLKVAGLMVADT